MRLYAYYRSSTSYRVRIGLNLKGLDYETVSVDLRTGEQRAEACRGRNPFAGVPCLEADGRFYAQSMPILEWLDECFPEPPLRQPASQFVLFRLERDIPASEFSPG